MRWFKAILDYFPVILQGIIAVEQALKGTPGATKKQIVLNVINAGAEAGKQIPEGHVQAVSTLIDASVDALNAAGVFNHDGGK
jgi:hypothetical protein